MDSDLTGFLSTSKENINTTIENWMKHSERLAETLQSGIENILAASTLLKCVVREHWSQLPNKELFKTMLLQTILSNLTEPRVSAHIVTI